MSDFFVMIYSKMNNITRDIKNIAIQINFRKSSNWSGVHIRIRVNKTKSLYIYTNMFI